LGVAACKLTNFVFKKRLAAAAQVCLTNSSITLLFNCDVQEISDYQQPIRL